MTNRRTTKQLLVSVVLLIVCILMLLGTTFAWFTDNATSPDNKVEAGTLDVQLWMYNGTEYENIGDSAKPIFGAADSLVAQNNAQDTLWEPGKTQVVYLKIVNNGSLDLKYNVAINVRDTADDKNLYEVLEYAIDANAKATDAKLPVWDGGKKVNVGNNVDTTNVELPAKEEGTNAHEHYFALSVHMLEEAGNMYQGGYVEFDIKVAATQLASEEDSFDNTYDEDAYFTDAIVTNEEELKTAIAAASDGAIIGIKGNVTWTTGAGIGSTPFVENSATRSVSTKSTVKNLTLVGLEDGATFTAIGSGVGAIGIDDGTVTFKNLKIVDKSVSYAENNWEYGYLEFRGNTVFENCNIVNAIMMEGDSATFTNCTFNSNKDNEYAVWVSDGNATFTNCTFNGARGLKTHEAYGSEVDIITVIDCKFIELSKKPGMAIGTVNPDTTIYIVDNEFIGTQAGDQGLYSYETDTDVTTFKFTYKDNIVPSSEGNGLYKDENRVFYATTSGGLSAGIEKAEAGDTIVLAQDVTYTGNGYANITKNITLDLGGNTLNTTANGVIAKAGTIKNGTVTNPVGGRAALRTWSGVSIENVVIESPLNGGITVASDNNLPYIKNVTINSKTYGIELQNGASVGSIENVTINAGENGIVSKGGTIGNMTNCVIEANNAGIWGQLKGVYDLKLDVDSTNVIKGDKYGVYLVDEGENIVPDGTAYFNYIDASVFNGGVKDMEFAFAQTGKLVINGNKAITSAAELLALGGKNLEGVYSLMSDIDLAGAAMPTIGAAGGKELTILGNGHTVSNAATAHTVHNGMKHHGFFYAYTNSTLTISNLIFEHITIDATKDAERNYGAAIVVAFADGGSNVTLNNVDVYNCDVLNNVPDLGDEAGVYVGYQTGTLTMKDCDSTGCSVAGETDVKTGAFIGMVNGTAYLNNCTTDLTIGYCNRIGGKLIVDGAQIVTAPITNATPAPYVGGLYEEGYNVVSYKDLKLEGKANITINNNASVAIENVVADVNGSVIIMDEYQPAIYVYGCEFTIDEGEYLIDASAVESGVYQIFLVNVKVNGEYLTQETADSYLNNVNWYQALRAENP